MYKINNKPRAVFVYIGVVNIGIFTIFAYILITQCNVMKKLFWLFFAFALTMGFSACGGSDEEEIIDEDQFTWNGDWNDPNDPKYFGGYYNPLEGTWINDKGTVKFTYTNDFKIYRYQYNKDISIWESELLSSKYIINDIGLFYTTITGKYTEEYKIIIENGEKFLLSRYQNLQYNGIWHPSTDWIKMKWLEE